MAAPALLELQEDLIRIKGEALQRFADGELDGEELMSGFLAHISDARDFLVRLILHQRDNLEDQARALHRRPEALWVEAIAEPDRPAARQDIEGDAATAAPGLSLSSVAEPAGSGAGGLTGHVSDGEF